MRKFWKIFLRSLGTYLGLAGGLSFKRFKVKGCQCAFLMHMGTRFTTEPVVSLGTEILFTFLQVSVITSTMVLSAVIKRVLSPN